MNFSLEIGPQTDLKTLPALKDIYITFLPGGDYKETAEQAIKLVNENKCNLIDIREINELENTGKVDGASHIPRGMLEVYLDPNSPVFQNGQIDQNKEFVLFCAGGVRSALAAKSLKDMGYQKVSHIDGGFGSIASSKFKII